MKKYLTMFSIVALAGCNSPSSIMSDEAKNVQILYLNGSSIDNCEWLGQARGSEGHWYDYIFYPNDVMIEGAMNQLVNMASDMGGDTVVLAPPHDFVTSVTYQASVYRCQK